MNYIKMGDLPEKIHMQKIFQKIAAHSPLFYYARSLKSPHFIYRWLAVWKI